MGQVYITTVNAGGGHKTAMYSLGKILETFAPKVKFSYFISQVEGLEKSHVFLNNYLYLGYEIVYRTFASTGTFKRIKDATLFQVNQQFDQELGELMSRPDCDVIITTHVFLTERSLVVKKKLGLDNVKIIAYVPDFDTNSIHFPNYKGLRPDGIIAQNSKFLQNLVRRRRITEKQVCVGGYMTRNEFTERRTLDKTKAKETLAEFNFPGAIRMEPDNLTITILGGSQWTRKIYSTIKELISSPIIDWSKVQIVIVCGSDPEAYKKYMRLRSKFPLHKILPLPFITPEQMATVMRSTDLTILSSIAPATMYELLEVQAGPIVINRRNPGQESYNLEFLIDSGIGSFIPKANDLISYVERYQRDQSWAKEQKMKFIKIADAQRTVALENAELVAEFIKGYAG